MHEKNDAKKVNNHGKSPIYFRKSDVRKVIVAN
jgi:hypothetical protein